MFYQNKQVTHEGDSHGLNGTGSNARDATGIPGWKQEESLDDNGSASLKSK